MVIHGKTSRRLQLKIISYSFLKAVFVLIKNINLTRIPLEEDAVIFKYAVRHFVILRALSEGASWGWFPDFASNIK